MNIDLKKFFLLAGPCAIESEAHCLFMASELKKITTELGIQFVFKAAWDKANRSSVDSYRGFGLEEGMRILKKVKDEVNVPIITDVHETTQVEKVAEVADVIQIPAFLCRQTDLILEVVRTGKVVNIKLGQFVSPWDAGAIVEKAMSTGNKNILLTYRGSTFGYNNLVVDFRAFPVMRKLGVPVVYDATHSLQLPGGGKETSGLREFIPALAKGAVATGVDGLFMEIHDTPEKALSDASTQFPLSQTKQLLQTLLNIRACLKN